MILFKTFLEVVVEVILCVLRLSTPEKLIIIVFFLV